MGVCDSTEDDHSEFEDDISQNVPQTKEEAEAVNLKAIVVAGEVHTLRAVITLAPDAVREWKGPESLSHRHENRSTLLHEAVIPSIADSREMIVKLLIDARVPVNAEDTCGRTALHNAAVRDNPEIAKALVEANADPNAKDNDKKTALNYAEDNSLDEMAAVLRQLVEKPEGSSVEQHVSLE